MSDPLQIDTEEQGTKKVKSETEQLGASKVKSETQQPGVTKVKSNVLGIHKSRLRGAVKNTHASRVLKILNGWPVSFALVWLALTLVILTIVNLVLDRNRICQPDGAIVIAPAGNQQFVDDELKTKIQDAKDAIRYRARFGGGLVQSGERHLGFLEIVPKTLDEKLKGDDKGFFKRRGEADQLTVHCLTRDDNRLVVQFAITVVCVLICIAFLVEYFIRMWCVSPYLFFLDYWQTFDFVATVIGVITGLTHVAWLVYHDFFMGDDRHSDHVIQVLNLLRLTRIVFLFRFFRWTMHKSVIYEDFQYVQQGMNMFEEKMPKAEVISVDLVMNDESRRTMFSGRVEEIRKKVPKRIVREESPALKGKDEESPENSLQIDAVQPEKSTSPTSQTAKRSSEGLDAAPAATPAGRTFAEVPGKMLATMSHTASSVVSRVATQSTQSSDLVQVLFFGTSHIDPDIILLDDHGMDFRYSRAGALGGALYGAEDPSYSDGTFAFTNPEYDPDCDKSFRKLIIFAGIIGRECDVGQGSPEELRALRSKHGIEERDLPDELGSLRKPPPNFDSMKAGPWIASAYTNGCQALGLEARDTRSVVHTFYDLSAALPLAVITYSYAQASDEAQEVRALKEEGFNSFRAKELTEKVEAAMKKAGDEWIDVRRFSQAETAEEFTELAKKAAELGEELNQNQRKDKKLVTYEFAADSDI